MTTSERSVRPKESISHDRMRVWMEPGVITKRVNDHHESGHSVFQTQDVTKEDLQAFLCAVTEFGQELAIILEIDPKANRDAKDVLPVRYRIQNVMGDIVSELDDLL